MIEWQSGWTAFLASKGEDELLAEFARETGDANPRHPLHGKQCRVVGWRVRDPARYETCDTSELGLKGCKDLILHLQPDDRYAFVHLTWTAERYPNWPSCRVFDGVERLNDFLRGG